jgi:hypothetical protein
MRDECRGRDRGLSSTVRTIVTGMIHGGVPVVHHIMRLRRRMFLVAIAYLLSAVVFATLVGFGVSALATGLATGLDAWVVAWIVGGAFAVAGVLAIAGGALAARAAVAGDDADVARLARAGTLARYGRVLLLLAAAGTVAAAAVLAPSGDDERLFVIVVNAGLAVAFALFGLAADDVGRALRRVGDDGAQPVRPSV